MSNLSSIITGTVGSTTPGVNLITAPNESSIWTVSNVTKSTTTTAAELPLGPAIPTATKFGLHASLAGTGYVDVDCPQSLTNWALQLGWFARASSGFTAAITIASIKSYSSASNRTSDTSGTTITPKNSTIQGTAQTFGTTFETNAQLYYRITLSFAAQSGAWYSICQVQVGPGSNQQVPVVGNWQTFPVTFSNLSVSSSFGRWRRVGDSMEIFVTGVSNSTSASTINFAMPTGYTIDSTNIDVATDRSVVGSAIGFDASASSFFSGIPIVQTTTNIAVRPSGTTGAWGTSIPFAWASGDTIGIRATVPIAEWVGSGLNTGPGSQPEYVYPTGTWDSSTSTSAIGSQGAQMGSLGAARAKDLTWSSPTQSDHIFEVQGSTDRVTWVPLTGSRIGAGNIYVVPSMDSIGGIASGVFLNHLSSAVSRLVFGVYANCANDDSPGTAWPSDSYVRVKRYSNGQLPYAKADEYQSGLLSFYKEDDTTLAACTFQGNLGGSASAAVAIKITRVGRVVTIDFPSFTGVTPTGTSTSLNGNTLLPTWARPPAQRTTTCMSHNNGTWSVNGMCIITSGGQIQFYRDVVGTAYTNGAAAGWYPLSITYTV